MIYPNYYQQIPQQPMNYQPNQWNYSQQTQTPIVQNSGFISVRSEEEARNYPIAPGTSLRFQDENAPFVYEKIMGFSQFEKPSFTRYKLVKDDIPVNEVKEKPHIEEKPQIEFATLDDLTNLEYEIKNLQKQINKLKPKEIAKYDE